MQTGAALSRAFQLSVRHKLVFQSITSMIGQFGAIPLGIGAGVIGAQSDNDLAGNAALVFGML
jgi:hypothetical protein